MLFWGCDSKSVDSNIGSYKDYGIKINIPENWKPISAAEAGQKNVDPESDLLRLGFFDPNTGKKEGVLILSTPRNMEMDQIKTGLEDPEEFEKIKWKGHTCYYKKVTADTGTQGESFTFLKDDAAICFFIIYTESYADSVTNIMNNIIF